MPTVNDPAALRKAYVAARANLAEVPTFMVQARQTVFRSINPDFLRKPAAGGSISLSATIPLLRPYDSSREGKDRFTGPSRNTDVPQCGGLYCAMQQQALVNESAHYSRKAHAWALSGRCVLRLRITGSIFVADLSPHEPHALRFLRSLGPKTWEQMNDPHDCSVARGIGLACAQSGFLHGLSVQTVRTSNRSVEQRGDNLVLFSSGPPIRCVEVDQVCYFGKAYAPETFTVARP